MTASLHPLHQQHFQHFWLPFASFWNSASRVFFSKWAPPTPSKTHASHPNLPKAMANHFKWLVWSSREGQFLGALKHFSHDYGLVYWHVSIKDWFLEDSSSVCSIPLCSTCQYLKQYDAGGTQEQDGKLRWEERKESGEVGGERKCAQPVYRLKPRAWETVQWVEPLPCKCKELGWIPRTYYLKQDTEASSWNPCAPTEGGEIETAGPSAAHRLAILVCGQGKKNRPVSNKVQGEDISYLT